MRALPYRSNVLQVLMNILESIPTAQLLAELDSRIDAILGIIEKRVLEDVAEVYKVDVRRIIYGKDCKSAKYVAASLMRERGATWTGIGAALGYKDHSGAHTAGKKGDAILARVRLSSS